MKMVLDVRSGIMTKCDFCTRYHNDKCYWLSAMAATSDCERAIKRMTKALQNIGNKKKKKL